MGCVLLFCIALQPFAAGQTISLEESGAKWNVVSHTGCLRDSGNESSDIATPPSGPYFPLSANEVNLGLQDASYWFHFVVRNDSPHSRDYCIELDNPRLAKAELFLPNKSGGFETLQAGLLVSLHDRDSIQANPTFHITLQANETFPVFLRVKNRGWFLFRILMWDERAFERDKAWRNLGIGLLYGALLLMALQSAMVYLWAKDRSFLHNLLLVFSCLLYEATFQGNSSQYLWPNSPWWSDRAIIFCFGLASASAISVSRLFLTTSILMPRMDKVLKILFYLCILVPFGKLSDSLWPNMIVHAIGCVVPVVILLAALLCWRRRVLPATIFLAAWGVLLVGAMCFNLAGAGVLPWNFYTENAIHLGLGLAPLLFTVALADRVRRIDVRHRETLEQRVDERTRELQDALTNVKTLRGLVPICSSCKKVREDSGYWKSIERYVQEHSEADFTHGLCPECVRKLYGNDVGERLERLIQPAQPEK
jgi:hypothetical protein